MGQRLWQHNTQELGAEFKSQQPLFSGIFRSQDHYDRLKKILLSVTESYVVSSEGIIWHRMRWKGTTNGE